MSSLGSLQRVTVLSKELFTIIISPHLCFSNEYETTPIEGRSSRSGNPAKESSFQDRGESATMIRFHLQKRDYFQANPQKYLHGAASFLMAIVALALVTAYLVLWR